MKILITGITGFIGKELKNKLDGDIYGMVRWTHKKRDTTGFKPVYGDLRNYNDIVSIIKEIKPEMVFNLGAITPVSLSFERPFDYVDININGVVNLVEANRKFNPYLKKFIHASTPEVYGANENLPFTPDSRMMPNSPYAVSKTAGDLYLMYAFRAYGFPSILSRHANTYGRKDQNHFVIESIISQMSEKKELRLGAKKPKRDFLYIDDTINFYKKLLSLGTPGNVYTAGWNKSYSIGDVVEMAKDITKFDGNIIWNTLPRRPGEIQNMVLDSTKAKKELKWEPKITLKEGLKKVYEHWSIW